MPHVEREYDELELEENLWTLPAVLGDSLKCTCHMNHSSRHHAHHPNLLDDEHFHVEEAMCFAMSDTFSGNISAEQLYHSRLGHPGNNPKLLKRLVEVVGKEVAFKFMCPSCVAAKATKLRGAFTNTTRRPATWFGQRLHTDLIILPNSSLLGGYRYATVYVDEFSDYVWVYPMKK